MKFIWRYFTFSTLLIFIFTLINCTDTLEHPNQIPEYLSVKADTDESRERVYNFIKKSMMKLIVAFPEDIRIKNDYEKLFKNDSNFKEPDSWHTTCLYIGKDKKKTESEIYRKFKEGAKLDLVTSTFVYIPGKIMSAPVFFEKFKLIENKYPHMTLLVGEYRAVDSNYVLEAIFDHIPEMRNLYEKGMIKDRDYKIEKKLKNVKINFENHREETVESLYVLKSGSSLELKGTTTKNYHSSGSNVNIEFLELKYLE
jgi:hypothetical protein